MSAVWQKLWKSRNCSWLWANCRNGFAAGRCDPLDPEEGIFAEQNIAIAVPRSAAGAGCARECLRWPSAKIDPLQLSFRKKPDRSTVGRPERIACAIRSRERLCCHRVKRPQPQTRCTFVRCDKRQPTAVG